ncbi:MAG: SdrD B-like domain-containing protein, partial [Pirellulales bacterium]
GTTARGRLEVYDASDNLLDVVLTADLAHLGDEWLRVRRATADIAYAIAGAAGVGDVYLSNLEWTVDHTTTTNLNGVYTFTDVPSGTYSVRELHQADWLRTAPTRGFHSASVVAADAVTGRNFGNAQRGAIQGEKWHDLDADGVRDASEPTLPFWPLFLDLDSDGVWDVDAVQLPVEVDRFIPTIGTRTSTVDVSGLSGRILDVNVAVDITHFGIPDLDVYLVSPSGTRVELVTDVGDLFDKDFAGTTFDDEARHPITSGSGSFFGPFWPEGFLGQFDGETPNGAWMLEVIDDGNAGFGRLNSWQLNLSYGEPSTRANDEGKYTLERLPPGTYTVTEFPQGPVTLGGSGSDTYDSGLVFEPIRPQLPDAMQENIYPITVVTTPLPGGEVIDIDVEVDILSTNTALLDIYLRNPQGERVALARGLSGSTGFRRTIFDDSATTSITGGTAPFTGTFQPEDRLSRLSGAPFGTWALVIATDVVAGGSLGTLREWSLTLTAANVDGQPNQTRPTFPSSTALAMHSFQFGQFAFGTLYHVDPTTGVPFHPQFSELDAVAGIAFAPDGDLYGLTTETTIYSTPNTLYRIDPRTGTSTAIGPTGHTIGEGDIDFDPTTGVLYGLYTLDEGQFSLPRMFTINLATGAATECGLVLPGTDLSAMAFDAGGNLYAIDSIDDQLLQLSKNSASILTSVALNHDVGTQAGIDFDPVSGTLYLIDGGNFNDDSSSGIYTIDPATGQVTLVGRAGGMGDFVDIEFAPGRSGSASHGVFVESQQTVAGIDFGNTQFGRIEGRVWDDANFDRLSQPGEAGLPGWTVYADLNDNGALDGAGGVDASDFAANTMIGSAVPGVRLSAVGSAAASSAVFTRFESHEDANGMVLGHDNPRPSDGARTLWNEDLRLRMEFGEPVAAVSIHSPGLYLCQSDLILEAFDAAGRKIGRFTAPDTSGTVDADLVFSRSQADIKSAEAYGACDGGWFDRLNFSQEPHTTTDANGDYALTQLHPRGYTFRQVPQSNWTQVFPDPQTGDFHSVSFGSGGTLSGIDFGNVQPGRIEGRVWNDRNGDGFRQASETRHAGAVVRAIDPVSGAAIVQTVSGIDGVYVLDGVVPGDYVVQFVAPPEHAFSPPNQGGSPSFDSNAHRITGRSSPVSILPREIIRDIDAGLIPPDRFEQNDAMNTATDLGVMLAVREDELTISTAGDDDWFGVELLRSDDVHLALRFTHGFGDLGLELLDAQGVVIGGSNVLGDEEVVTLTDLTAGAYWVRVYGVGQAVNVYDLEIRPAATSATRIFYVNDNDTFDDLYTRAIGSDANDGLSSQFPKATVQDVLADYDLGANDLVLVDTGDYVQGVQITATDSGAAFAGTPRGSYFSAGPIRWELVNADFNLIYRLRFAGTSTYTGIYARGDGASGSTDNIYRDNSFETANYAIRIDGGAFDAIENNFVYGGVVAAFHVVGGGLVTIRGNQVWAATQAVYTTVDSTIEDNQFAATGTVVQFSNSAATLTARRNSISGGAIGLHVGTGTAEVAENEVFGNVVGIRSNTVGMNAFGNYIHHNGTGIAGGGTLGGADWSPGQPNVVERNTTGISSSGGMVRFNRVHRNVTGIEARGTAEVHHNAIFRNDLHGIVVNGGSGVRLTNNTVY